MSNSTDPKESGHGLSQIQSAIRTIGWCAIIGLVSMVLWGFQTSAPDQYLSVVAGAAGISGAALLIGALLGFLFGIPRTLQNEPPSESSSVDGKAEANKGTRQDLAYQANTNLEQISDWLTKILVGLGLTQLTTVPETLKKYADYVSPALGGFPGSQTYAIALLLYYLVCGFLIGWLWTRIYLGREFREADAAMLDEVKSRVDELQKQAENDVKALALTQRLLSAATGTQPVTQTDIDAAIREASSSAKTQVFYQAQSMRSDNWRDPQAKPKMERTIPVFRALIASDTDEAYHMNHGQLGYALKDQRQPDWEGAASEFTTAIKIRGPLQKYGYPLYEFNRAVSRIHLDKAFAERRPSDAKSRDDILADLRAVASFDEVWDIIVSDGDGDVAQWLRLNQLTARDLRSSK